MMLACAYNITDVQCHIGGLVRYVLPSDTPTWFYHASYRLVLRSGGLINRLARILLPSRIPLTI